MSVASTLTKPDGSIVSQTEHTRSGRYFRPSVDILELPDELLVLADVPGAQGEDIDVKFENGELTIHARVKAHDKDERTYLAREWDAGDFFRTFQVSEAVDASRIAAESSNGTLTLHLPKAESVKPRTIKVQPK